jgi:hypothetical protein
VATNNALIDETSKLIALRARSSLTILDKHRMREEGSAPLLFDNDIQQKITLIPSVAKSLASQIANDIIFLKSQGLMDYSLLVGVKRQRFEVIKENLDAASSSSNRRETFHGTRGSVVIDTGASALASIAIDEKNPFQKHEDGGVRAAIVEGPGTFYFGIIDVLQEWNLKKKIERYFKVYVLGVDADGLSAIEPETYASRFFHGAVIDFFDGIDDHGDHNPLRFAGMMNTNVNRQLYRRSCNLSGAACDSSTAAEDDQSSSSIEMKSPVNPYTPSLSYKASEQLISGVPRSDSYEDDKSDGSSSSSTATYVMTDGTNFKKYKESRSRSVVSAIFPFTATASTSDSGSSSPINTPAATSGERARTRSSALTIPSSRSISANDSEGSMENDCKTNPSTLSTL